MILLPFFAVRETCRDDAGHVTSEGVADDNDDHSLDGADAGIAGLAIITTVVDAGQNVAFEDQTGFFERDPVLDLVGDILRGVPLLAHDAL